MNDCGPAGFDRLMRDLQIGLSLEPPDQPLGERGSQPHPGFETGLQDGFEQPEILFLPRVEFFRKGLAPLVLDRKSARRLVENRRWSGWHGSLYSSNSPIFFFRSS
jgi:hypothetical protein